eukprot:TRINITY_DN7391_c0_g1_i1.p1 TRINITY_DN7391_c0_g1~~TRINITY_DN7391_c0_g1_i1.p1  ORF type:complete len:168 (-),score=44.98 TRINITY_DN7391_c0_g1_i1:134-568(-)
MATRATASAVIALPIEQVWKALREFDFPAKLISTVTGCELTEGSATSVGAVRKVSWTGQWKKQRLIELSDLHYTATWELIESEPISETLAAISTLKCIRVTEDNSTVVSWSTDFSSDVPRDLVAFEQKSYQENLREIRKALTGK